MDFWKGRQNPKKQNRKNINSLRQAFSGNNIDKKPLEMQENNHFGLLCTKQKHRNTEKPKKQNHQNPKKDQKNTFVHSGKPPLFLFFFGSLMSAKLCFAGNTIKIVFSAEHSF